MKTKPWCLRYFTYDHLPEGLIRVCAEEFANIANSMLTAHYQREGRSLEKWFDLVVMSWVRDFTPENEEACVAREKIDLLFDYIADWNMLEDHEIETAFRLLLEAKDCAVRSLLEVSDED